MYALLSLVSPRPHACRRARGRREEQKEEEKKGKRKEVKK
jgi:hypothetical protein